ADIARARRSHGARAVLVQRESDTDRAWPLHKQTARRVQVQRGPKSCVSGRPSPGQSGFVPGNIGPCSAPLVMLQSIFGAAPCEPRGDDVALMPSLQEKARNGASSSPLF